MSVPLTLVLALPSVAALTRTHLIAPDPAVLLCEHIWYLEDEIEKIWVDESHPDHQDVRDNPQGTQEFMVSSIEFHAMRLWKGEQVDGTILRSWARAYEEWGLDPTEGGSMPGSFILKWPSAVMAGWRYLTSLQSTPRYMRYPMHEDLFRRSCEFRSLNALK